MLPAGKPVQLISNGKDVLVREQFNGSHLWDESPEQAIVPLILRMLPRGIGMGKVDLAAPCFLLGNVGKLAAMVQSSWQTGFTEKS